MKEITIIGGGLAGCEAALQITKRGINVKLYDYVNKGDFLGEVIDNNLYIVFQKDKEYLEFENYIKD